MREGGRQRDSERGRERVKEKERIIRKSIKSYLDRFLHGYGSRPVAGMP